MSSKSLTAGCGDGEDNEDEDDDDVVVVVVVATVDDFGSHVWLAKNSDTIRECATCLQQRQN